MTRTFWSARVKVERAIQHIDELSVCMEAFSKEDIYSLFVDEDPETGRNYLRFSSKGDMWPDIPLIIGDAIHNLSSALDYLTSEIVAAAGLRSDRVTFPMHEDREQLIKSTKAE